MIPARSSCCPTELLLEEHMVLPDLRIAAHLATCARCKAWVIAAGEVGEQFETEVLPDTLPSVLRAMEEPARPPFPTKFLTAVAATASAAGLLLAVGLIPVERAPVLLAKGSGLTVFVRHAGDVHAASSGEAVSPGDGLRFSIVPPGPRHVWILSVDSQGEVSRLAPVDGGPAEVKGPVMLPGSAVLDESPGPERIFAVLSRHPLSWEKVQSAAVQAISAGGDARVRDLSRLPLPGTEQSTLLLERRR